MSAYSFLDVLATLVGPGGSFSLGSGVGAAEEGITVAMDEDKNTTLAGADGQITQSLHAANVGLITVRLLKTSPVNRLLSLLYNSQRMSSAIWGRNQINVSDVARGDLVLGSQMAFVKHPDLTWSKDANTNEWQFRGVIQITLGDGNAIAA